jgi:hypothetical protein
MVKDLTTTINELRCSAVGRCRERLEQAAQKAKGILKTKETEEVKETPQPSKDQYGVSSILKRKHGL